MHPLFRFILWRGATPDPMDPRIPVSQRVGRKSFAIINLGSFGAKVARGRYLRDGALEISDVAFYSPEPSDTKAGLIVPSGAIVAAGKLSDSRMVVLGYSVSGKTNVKSNTRDTEVIEKMTSGYGGYTSEVERSMVLPFQRENVMLRASISDETAKLIESAFKEAGLLLIRLHITPYVMLNTLAGLADFAPDAVLPDGVSQRMPLVLDQAWLGIFTRSSTHQWAMARFTPMLRNQSESEEDMQNVCDQFDQTLKQYCPKGIVEFVVLDSGTPRGLLKRVETATARLSGRVRYRLATDLPDVDLISLCEHP